MSNVFSSSTLDASGSIWSRALWRIEASARRFSRKLAGGTALAPPGGASDDVESLGDQANRGYLGVREGLPVGSVKSSRQILQIIGEGFPTPLLVDAYFTNLSACLAATTPLLSPGKLVIGLGSGRSGSTSLAARLAAVDNSCSTHENPPLLFWRPATEQIAFHLRRFAMLRSYYALVADCAHWWINLTDELVQEFPDVKFVGLVRNKYECTVSFARIKGVGRGTYNHWAEHPNSFWIPTLWDPTYPTFETPDWADRDPDLAKWGMIEKYLDLYNSKLAAAALRHPDRFLLLPTKHLDDPKYVGALYDFIGVAPSTQEHPVKLNVRSTKDGRLAAFKV